MKRRDFLTATAGLAGTMLPVVTRGQSKPCPPELIGVNGGQTLTTACSTSGPAPAWFAALPEGQWAEVAGRVGGRIFDVKPSPLPGGSLGIVSVTGAWTGGCVDQVRGELILCANGGHGDYFGNETYAIALREEDPKWQRLTDPTPTNPPQYLGGVDDTKGQPAAFSDGKMRAVHGWHHQCFGNGKVWHGAQIGYCNIGYSAWAPWSFDRTTYQWTSYGAVSLPFQALGNEGGTCYDRVGNKIWTVGSRPEWCLVSVDCATGERAVYSNQYGPNTIHAGWVALAHDIPTGNGPLGVFVVPVYGENRIVVKDLNKPSAAWMSFTPSDPDGHGANPAAYGGVYHSVSKAIFTHCPKQERRQHLEAIDPTQGDGTFNSSGTLRGQRLRPRVKCRTCPTTT